MCKVLQSGAQGSNKIRKEEGKDEIPTAISIFKLKRPPQKVPVVNLKDISSIGCVTFIPQPNRRINASDTGFYVNVYPWIPYRKGKPVPAKEVLDGDNMEPLNLKQRTLRPEHMPAGELDRSFKNIKKQHANRCKLLKKMKLNVKQVHSVRFEV